MKLCIICITNVCVHNVVNITCRWPSCCSAAVHRSQNMVWQLSWAAAQHSNNLKYHMFLLSHLTVYISTNSSLTLNNMLLIHYMETACNLLFLFHFWHEADIEFAYLISIFLNVYWLGRRWRGELYIRKLIERISSKARGLVTKD